MVVARIFFSFLMAGQVRRVARAAAAFARTPSRPPRHGCSQLPRRSCPPAAANTPRRRALPSSPQLLVAGLIIGLVATKLNSIKLGFDAQNLSASMQDTCLLGSAPNGVNLCYVAYGFSGVSILASGALSLLMCCTCNLCGLGFLLDTIFAAAGTAW